MVNAKSPIHLKSPMHVLQAIETAPDRMIMPPSACCAALGLDLKAADLGRQARAPRGAAPSSVSTGLSHNLHIFEVPRLVVDADARGRDPACEFAGLDHLLHQALDEFAIVTRGQPFVL